MLKQTFWNIIATIVSTFSIVAVILLTWQYATEQSKTQISDWLQNTNLMRDIAVVISIDTLIQISYAVLEIKKQYENNLSKRVNLIYNALKYIPTMLIYPTMFSILTALMFTFTGREFSTTAYMLAAFVMIVLPLSRKYLIPYILPEKELRLELLFITNILIMLFGIIATVNGRTYASSTNNADIKTFLLTAILCSVFVGVGLIYYMIKRKRTITNNLK